MTMLAIDTETRGLNWWAPEEQAFLGQWADAEEEWHADLTTPEGRAEFADALSSADVIVAHNLSFDAHMVRAVTGYDILQTGVELHDTDLMSRLLFPEGQRDGARGGHGLKNLAVQWLHPEADQFEKRVETRAKQLGMRAGLKTPGAYYRVWQAFPEDLELYGRSDVRFTYDLFERFRVTLQQPAFARTLELYELERQVQRDLIIAEQTGVLVDSKAVERLKAHYLELDWALCHKLNEQLGAGVYEGEGSREALAEILRALGVPLTQQNEDGSYSTSRAALQPFANDFPVIKDLFEYRRIQKFLSTYIAPMEGREVVHPSFLQVEAWTGRMSCRNPNMQNIPKRRDLSDDENLRVRSMFVPRPGYGFVVADFDSIEYMLYAYFAGVPEFRRFMADPRNDPHARQAAAAFGGSPADYLKGTPGQVKRDIAKHSTYAILYGAGGPKVTDTINRMVGPEDQLTLGEGKSLVQRIKRGLPGYWQLNNRIRAKIAQDGYVTTVGGRRQVLHPDKSYVGMNALIQGSAADIMKKALVNVARDVDYYGGCPLLVVHDELVVEVPSPRLEIARVIVQEAMERAGDFYGIRPALRVDAKTTKESYAHAK